jgi:hypothetical protein
VAGTRLRSRCSRLAGCALLWSGCSLSAGPAFTRPARSDSSIATGASVEASLQLPRNYQTVAGIEWTRSGTPSDLWRLGIFYGYTTLPTARGRLAWEVTARGGLLGAVNETSASPGGFGGARVAMLVHLGDTPEPWQADSPFVARCLIVADAGVNGLARSGSSPEAEFSSRLLFRIQLSSALLP